MFGIESHLDGGEPGVSKFGVVETEIDLVDASGKRGEEALCAVTSDAVKAAAATVETQPVATDSAHGLDGVYKMTKKKRVERAIGR